MTLTQREALDIIELHHIEKDEFFQAHGDQSTYDEETISEWAWLYGGVVPDSEDMLVTTGHAWC